MVNILVTKLLLHWFCSVSILLPRQQKHWKMVCLKIWTQLFLLLWWDADAQW